MFMSPFRLETTINAPKFPNNYLAQYFGRSKICAKNKNTKCELQVFYNYFWKEHSSNLLRTFYDSYNKRSVYRT